MGMLVLLRFGGGGSLLIECFFPDAQSRALYNVFGGGDSAYCENYVGVHPNQSDSA
jgi:hypothetical protein